MKFTGLVVLVLEGFKRIRLNRKTPAHLAGSVLQSRPREWKRLCHVGRSFVPMSDRKRRRREQQDRERVAA